MTKGYFYILSNSTRNLLYAGATRDVIKRLRLHELGMASVFTKRYHVKYLYILKNLRRLEMPLKEKSK